MTKSKVVNLKIIIPEGKYCFSQDGAICSYFAWGQCRLCLSMGDIYEDEKGYLKAKNCLELEEVK